MTTPAAKKLDKDLVYSIVVDAINISKSEQICTVEKLKARLNEMFSGKSTEVDAAIQLWAASIN